MPNFLHTLNKATQKFNTQKPSQTRFKGNLIQIFLGGIGGFFFSAFIYLEHYFDSYSPIFPSFFVILALLIYLHISRLGAFVYGAVVGLLWFYWIAFSLRFFDLSFLIPLSWIGIALVYGILFLFFAYFKNSFFRILTLSLASFIQPFDFNWFIPEITLVESYFFASKINLFLLLTTLAIFSFFMRKKYHKTSFLLLIIGILITLVNAPSSTQTLSTLKIQTTHTQVPQELRWKPQTLKTIQAQNFALIDEAINQKNNIVILPETAFPTILNQEENLMQLLCAKSHQITIISGGIHKKDNRYFNSAFIFQQGEVQIIDKIILVPFGETIPLPKFLARFIDDFFFQGSGGFDLPKDSLPQSIQVEGEEFRIAICYEATREEFFKDSPKNLIAISNNAWFYPSIESTLQKLLMQYFSNLYQTTIYHSSNYSPDFTLHPLVSKTLRLAFR